VYEPAELAAMAAPLLLAALAEWRCWRLGPWRRWLEALALLCLLGLFGIRIGLVPSLVLMLFLLCGIRLSLPREEPQRRQLLLMGFLIWSTTAISTFEIHFLLWAILWVAGAALTLMQQAWERSANLRNGPLPRAPYGRLPGWVLGTVLLSAGFFVVLPRLTLGLRSFPWGVAGLTGAQAGMSDSLELSGSGPITPNSEVVLRILPAGALSTDELTRYAHALSLLRGVALESLEGQRWMPDRDTPAPIFERLDPDPLSFRAATPGQLQLDCFVAPSPQGILPLPYGRLGLAPPPGMPLRSGFGGTVRWMYPSRRPLPLRILADPAFPITERPPGGKRWSLLTQTGVGTESADRWARQRVPVELPPQELADRLTHTLQTFRYTLDNPSGKAANPLQDFLEHSHSGHCEYFASALALMLRYRGIPARVVNGYRLGPWIGEGGYWLVTQNEAHSWVEYFDAGTRSWHVADPTPPAPPDLLGAATLWAFFERWTDALRFRWDRNVVRFSGEDQLAGLEWMRSRVATLPDWRPSRSEAFALALASALGGALLLWRRTRRSGRFKGSLAISAYALVPLKPLLRVAGRRNLPPASGETLRHWLGRLSTQLPERSAALAAIAAEADAVAYGDRGAGPLKALVKAETKVWKQRRKP
jgi:hypothetical protein